MSWMNISRVLKVLALVLFLTPWLMVSCQGSPVIDASGVDLVTGDLEPSPDSSFGSMMAQTRIEAAASGSEAPTQEADEPGMASLQDGRWWVAIGGTLIALSLGLGFALRPAARATRAALLAGALSLGVLGGGMAWTVEAFKAELRDAAEQSPSDGAADEMAQFGRTVAAGFIGGIDIEVRWGYWLMIVSLGLGVVAAGLAATGRTLPQPTSTVRHD